MGTMKRRSPDSSPPDGQETTDPLGKEDALWSLLGEASGREADAFFARNTVRRARLLADASPPWGTRLAAVFSTRKALLPLAAAACIGAVAVTQLSREQPPASPPAPVVQADPADDASAALAELVIEESLVAAADDPSQFTHDEVVAMVGL